jgi:S-adenosylmethionine:tRNA ribosyltransferase-isomerase
MRAATYDRALDETLLLVIDRRGRFLDARMDALPALFHPGDLVVVNDAATLPAALRGRGPSGDVELRLLAREGDGTWKAFVLGGGTWRTPTERRPSARLRSGDRVHLEGFFAEIVALERERLARIRFSLDGAALLHALYTVGRPVQYAHLSDELALWTVQTGYASRPWAVEMPSAGRPLQWRQLLALRQKGVQLRALTHAAGLSSSGEAALDAALPLGERYDIPRDTAAAVEQTKQRGGRVLAVGTSVVRALESAIDDRGRVKSGEATTELRIGPAHRLRAVDALLTGIHDPAASHFALLAAFVPEALLRDAYAHAERKGYLGHELGDACLIV